MNWRHWENLKNWFITDEPDTENQLTRIRIVERNIVLPVKGVFIAIVFYFLFYSQWLVGMVSMREHVLEFFQRFLLLYLFLNVGIAFIMLGIDQLPLRLVRWIVFIVAIIDVLALVILTSQTGGYESILFWVYLGMIARNSVSIPLASMQILLNLIVSLSFILAGALDDLMFRTDIGLLFYERQMYFENLRGDTTESVILRLALLLLLTACCYGIQLLFDKQRKAEEEAREFALRQEQLRASGRLAAEIAHKLKNPLGIINNASFTLQRNVKEGKSTITQQIQIIREEINRSDRIITDLMGYARLTEGRVERLNVTEEIDRVVEEVFPQAVKYSIEVVRNYAPVLPILLMQRVHLNEILVNLLQNAREAMNGVGRIEISAECGENYSVVITISDNGPGINKELRDMIFEPYFTNKEKGSGLGLAIVKHNIEMYGGTVEINSVPDTGTKFILKIPARSIMSIRK
ncbi:MAG: GHKL domain-containing protein [Verrucomicrobia bacterium]|nr:GHKL domain-containing protein [Verrucomicrobiota bacterium]MCF7707658.1 GHKL domain-containing protein [Verrucomicrobiota bacterium]